MIEKHFCFADNYFINTITLPVTTVISNSIYMNSNNFFEY